MIVSEWYGLEQWHSMVLQGSAGRILGLMQAASTNNHHLLVKGISVLAQAQPSPRLSAPSSNSLMKCKGSLLSKSWILLSIIIKIPWIKVAFHQVQFLGSGHSIRRVHLVRFDRAWDQNVQVQTKRSFLNHLWVAPGGKQVDSGFPILLCFMTFLFFVFVFFSPLALLPEISLKLNALFRVKITFTQGEKPRTGDSAAENMLVESRAGPDHWCKGHHWQGRELFSVASTQHLKMTWLPFHACGTPSTGGPGKKVRVLPAGFHHTLQAETHCSVDLWSEACLHQEFSDCRFHQQAVGPDRFTH